MGKDTTRQQLVLGALTAALTFSLTGVALDTVPEMAGSDALQKVTPPSWLRARSPTGRSAASAIRAKARCSGRPV